jgi:type VI protein secretion system component VasF
MAEEVSTGGLMKFRYEKESESKLSDERKKEIREAYAQADERKRRERRNRIIFWIIGLVGLVVLVLLLRFLL